MPTGTEEGPVGPGQGMDGKAGGEREDMSQGEKVGQTVKEKHRPMRAEEGWGKRRGENQSPSLQSTPHTPRKHFLKGLCFPAVLSNMGGTGCTWHFK